MNLNKCKAKYFDYSIIQIQVFESLKCKASAGSIYFCSHLTMSFPIRIAANHQGMDVSKPVILAIYISITELDVLFSTQVGESNLATVFLLLGGNHTLSV